MSTAGGTTARPSASPGAPGRPTRGTWGLRDRPGLVWLVLAAATALVHPFVPGSTWLMVHMVALGAMSHSVMVWSTHFATTLLKTAPDLDPRAAQGRRLLLLHAGAVLVLVGVPTSLWPATVVGATLVVAAVAWHAVALWRRLRHALPGRFRVTVRSYLAAAACLPVGALLGTLLARGPDDEMHARLVVAHSLVNVLGWLGITVVATVVTLWPTMLRAPMDADAERRARTALPVLVGGLALAVTAALVGSRPLVAVGLLVYLAGLARSASSMAGPARARPPRHHAPASVAAGLLWLVAGVLAVAWRVATAPTWADAATGYDAVAAVFVVGFMLQVLLGALSHLVPSVIGGGPSVVRAGMREMDRWWVLRLVVVNGGLALCLLPVPSGARVLCSVLVLLALVVFVPLLFRAVRACVAQRRAIAERMAKGESPPSLSQGRAEVAAVLDAPVPLHQLGAGLAALALAVAAGPATAPVLGTDVPAAASEQVAPTGVTRDVEVTATADMTFEPSRVDVDPGDRVVITVRSTDASTRHDLVFDDEHRSERIGEGESSTLDLGVVGSTREGFCSVTGHRLMGMTFTVAVRGEPAGGTQGSDGGGHTGHDDAAGAAAPGTAGSGGSPFALDPTARWSDGFEAADAVLPPLDDDRVHRVTLTVRETTAEVAPGVRATRWTFDDGSGRTGPGPVLHGRVGDRFVITLVNDGSMGHSVDLHAGELAPDRPMRTIAPGERLTYTFTATRAGMWMYHCSTMPMSTHIGAGMHGAVVIEPEDLPEVDRSYVLVASEMHLGTPDADGVRPVDAEAAAGDRPSLMTFNGAAFQYDAQPLPARVGERVRIWLLAAGPSRPTSFHVVGGQLDTTWLEGASTLDRRDAGAGGAQALGLLPAQGGFVETRFVQAGRYPFVSHVMADAERGAHGVFEVTDAR